MPITCGYLIPGVWSRHGDPEVLDKHSELFRQLSKITGSGFNSNDWEVMDDRNADEEDKYQCICSCYQLQTLYVVRHVPTNTKVGVGSSCIHQFENEELSKNLIAEKRNNRCSGGNLIPDMRTTEARIGLCPEVFCTCKGYTDCKKCGDKCKTCIRGLCLKCICIRCMNEECTCKKCTKCDAVVDEDWKKLCLTCYIGKMKCVGCETLIPKSRYKIRCSDCWRLL
jgi:hypothetical protein